MLVATTKVVLDADPAAGHTRFCGQYGRRVRWQLLEGRFLDTKPGLTLVCSSNCCAFNWLSCRIRNANLLIDWTSFRNGIARIEGKVRQLQFIRIGVFSVDTFEKMPCSVAYNVDKGIKLVDALGRHWILPINACDLWRVRLMHQRYLIVSPHQTMR